MFFLLEIDQSRSHFLSRKLSLLHLPLPDLEEIIKSRSTTDVKPIIGQPDLELASLC